MLEITNNICAPKIHQFFLFHPRQCLVFNWKIYLMNGFIWTHLCTHTDSHINSLWKKTTKIIWLQKRNKRSILFELLWAHWAHTHSHLFPFMWYKNTYDLARWLNLHVCVCVCEQNSHLFSSIPQHEAWTLNIFQVKNNKNNNRRMQKKNAFMNFSTLVTQIFDRSLLLSVAVFLCSCCLRFYFFHFFVVQFAQNE